MSRKPRFSSLKLTLILGVMITTSIADAQLSRYRIHGPIEDFFNSLDHPLDTDLLATFLGTNLFTADSVGTRVLAIGIYVNVLLMVINLIPIPPLDGSRVMQYFLTPRALQAYQRLERFGLVILLFLFMAVPPFKIFLGGVLTGTLETVTGWFGIWPEVNYALVKVFMGR